MLNNPKTLVITVNGKRDVVKSVLVFLLLLVVWTVLPVAKADNAALFPKDSTPFGVSYGDWIERWWQWNFGILPAEHPRDHFTPQRCTIDQNGSVWYLPDILSGKEERTCTIPNGKAILVPLLTGICDDDNTDPSLKTDEGLRNCAMQGDEYGVLSASLDGSPLQDVNQYRTQTNFFNLTVPVNNFGNNVPGTFKSMADGFFVFLKPLPVGKHDLVLTTSVSNPVAPSYNYAAESKYHLIIKENATSLDNPILNKKSG